MNVATEAKLFKYSADIVLSFDLCGCGYSTGHWSHSSLFFQVSKSKYLQNFPSYFLLMNFEFLHFQAVASHMFFLFYWRLLLTKTSRCLWKWGTVWGSVWVRIFPPSSPMEEIKQLPDCKYQVGDVFCALAACSVLVPNVMPHTYYNTFLIKNCFNQPKLFC